MLRMCCLSFAQEEKDDLGLLLSAEFIRSAANTFSQQLGYGLYEESSVLQNGVANAKMYRTVATAKFGGCIDVRTQIKLLLPIGVGDEFREFFTLGNPVSAFRSSAQKQHNLVVSGGLVVHS